MLAVQVQDRPAPRPPPWRAVRPVDVWRWPLPELPSAADRLLARLAGLLGLGRIGDIEGWEHILARHDPFLLVANHSSRREAVLLPAILLLARGGKPVRFLADWNFRLIPGVGQLYDRSGTITLTRKDAKPRVLNRLKPLFEPHVPAHVEARRHLTQGGSIGIFPEGTVNRDGSRLLRGRRGAARLSLEAGVPVVPVGPCFARQNPRTGAVDPASPMGIRFGEPIRPPPSVSRPASLNEVHDWHGELMSAIARLCGKGWPGALAHRTAETGEPGKSNYLRSLAADLLFLGSMVISASVYPGLKRRRHMLSKIKVDRVRNPADRDAALVVLKAAYQLEKRWVERAESQIPDSDLSSERISWFLARRAGEPGGVLRVHYAPPGRAIP